MNRPPAMGVFARDDPPASHIQPPQSLAQSYSTTHTDISAAPEDLEPEETGIVQQDDGQDDDQGTVDEEAGIIRCICSSDEDDGFTIQCDRCLVWQHCACFGMSQASVPDEYLCELCSPRPVDVAFAVAHQQKRKSNEARKALMDRNLKKQAQALASANYTQEYLSKEAASNSSISSPSSLPAHVTGEPNAASDEQLAAGLSHSYTNSRSRKPSQALDLSNTQFVVPDLPASAGGSARGAASATKQRKGQKGSRRGPETPTAASTPNRGTFTPGSTNEKYENPFDLAEQLEAWHIEFTPITKNIVSEPKIIHSLTAAMLDWEDGSPLKAVPSSSGRMAAPVSSPSTGRAHDAMDEDDADPVHDIDLAVDPTDIVLSAVRNECIPVELHGPSLDDLAARTYVRHISETASAGVFSNVLHVATAAEEPQRGWCASKAFSRPVMHGLFADSAISAGTFVSEFIGEMYDADSYRNNPINQFAALGATKAHVHLFPPPLNLAIDARRFGNEARFARFSCHPNAVLRPILFNRTDNHTARSRTSSRAQSPSPLSHVIKASADLSMTAESKTSEGPELLFGIFAIADIPRNGEITLGWEWDDSHIVHFLPELVRNPYLQSRKSFGADRHTANMVALAEKGDFPYAYTEFSTKMSTVAAALLGSVLCACIGSAAPPGGGSGASTNNGRKQDCAVAQMLRVGNGMALLNVPMPGKPNRRAKLPKFSPLVGARRNWRASSLPLTPESLVKEGTGSDALNADENVLASDMLRRDLLLDDHGEMGCGRMETNSRTRVEKKDLPDHVQSDHSSDSDDEDDARSVASSLTEPLSGLSYDDDSSAEKDVDLARALRLADGLSVSSENRRRASQQDDDRSGLFILPPKKRSIRTRIKATMSPSDEEDADDTLEADETARSDSRRSSGAFEVPKKSSIKRKTSRLPSRLSINFDSDDDDEQMERSTVPKKQRRSGKIADPSSPLSSVSSPDSDETSSSPPPVPRLSSKHRFENERHSSDLELPKQKRVARRGGKDRSSQVRRKASEELDPKMKKRQEARQNRQSLLDLGDTESSDEASDTASDGEVDNDPTAQVDGIASTPKASTRKLPASGDTRMQDGVVSSPRSETSASPRKEAPTKVKKSRRVFSDSESDGDDNMGLGQKTPLQSPLVTKTESDVKSEAAPDNAAPPVNPSGDTPTPVSEVKEPEVEVKKEEPRVKLSLAEYKRRLADRRVSEQHQQGASATATVGTSEPLPAVEQGNSATAVATASAQSEPRQTPPQSASIRLASTPVEPARSFLFTSTSAPTGIRSVEIPKSPSPEPEQPKVVPVVKTEAADVPTSAPSTTVDAQAAADRAAEALALRARLEARRIHANVAESAASGPAVQPPSRPDASVVKPRLAPPTVPPPSLSPSGTMPRAVPPFSAPVNPATKPPRTFGSNAAGNIAIAAGGFTQTPAPDATATRTNSGSFASAAPLSAGSASARYSGAGMTTPSPTTSFLSGPASRDVPAIPKAPASMREPDQAPPATREAWNEHRDFASRSANEHSFRDTRESAWDDRDRMRWERDAPHRAERDSRDRESSAFSQSSRQDHHHHHQQQMHQYPHSHLHAPQYREYDDQPPTDLQYDRSADPYGRPMGGSGGGLPRDGREVRDYREVHDYRDSRDYDYDTAPPPPQHGYASHPNRGGYRGGWGGGGRSRGRGMGSRGGSSRGGSWMR